MCCISLYCINKNLYIYLKIMYYEWKFNLEFEFKNVQLSPLTQFEKIKQKKFNPKNTLENVR